MVLNQGDRHLVFNQDFRELREKALKEWKFNDGPVYNNEKEKYTLQKDGNVYFTDEGMVIEARKKDGVITSGRLESYKSFKHPFVEVVAKVPTTGNGTWPAVWMLGDSLRKPQGQGNYGWPDCGEIDIMEHVGYDPGNFHFSLHCKNYNWMRPKQRTATKMAADAGGWHKFGLDCAQSGITFYLDDKAVYTVKNDNDNHDDWPFNDPHFMILNLAIGGDWGGAKGIEERIFPSKFVIQSVKIYE